MSAFACEFTGACRVGVDRRRGLTGAARVARYATALSLGLLLFGTASALALDASQPTDAPKIPLKHFSSAEQALRAGLDDLKAGDAKSSLEALSYAAEAGQVLAQWKLGSMYARGEGVPRDDLKAYHYFEQMIDNFNEDEPNGRDISAVSNAFVAVGVYCLGGIANSDLKPDAGRALAMFQYAATNFGDPDAQYHLARFYAAGRDGLAKNEQEAVRFYKLAADQGNANAQFYVALFYETGRGGLAKDVREAARFYRMAADQGNASAQKNLAWLYAAGGDGLATDSNSAIRGKASRCGGEWRSEGCRKQ